MDKIYRKISLEDFKNRFTNEDNNAFGTEWGNVVQHDYAVDSASSLYDVADRIPLIEGNRLRFGTMIMLNTWLNNVIDNSNFFKLCQRKSKKTWIEYDYSITSEDEDFNFVGIYSEMPLSEEEFEIGDIIWVTEEAENLLNMFLADSGESQSRVIERMGEFFSIVEDAKNNDSPTIESGYTEINVMLTENCNEVGKFTTGVAFWEPNKEYCGGEYAFSPENGKVYYLNKAKTYSESTETFNESGFWVVKESDEPQGVQEIVGESRLDSLKRLKRSYDDYGNELPFIYNEENGTTEMFYVTGIIYNTSINGDKMYGDIISTITNSIASITFTYVIGAEILETNNGRVPKEGTGIVYKEGYKMSDESFTFRLNNANVTVEYKNIHFNEELSDYLPEGADANKRYAKITFNPVVHQIDSGVPFIMEESMVGITDVKKSGTATVERGTAAAFEMHNILGECRTMEDLEKYRNDFFTIKDDEKQ